MNKFTWLTLLGIACMMAGSCTKSELPVVTTNAVTGISPTSATCGGNITSDGGANIKARGVCWSTAPDPTTLNKKTDDGKGTGSFTSTLNGLATSTTYYVRAYATNREGTAYGNTVTFSTGLSDIDGNVYKTVTIGSQVWMAENLKTTKYRNGNAIEYPDTDNNLWYNNSTGAYAWYNSAAVNNAVYGALYKWHAVNNPAGLCPAGWHVPTDDEWTTLTDYLGGESVAASKLKEVGNTHWDAPNSDATDESGFTALPGGSRSEYGDYANIGYSGYFWCSNQYNMGNGWCRILNCNTALVTKLYSNKGFGYSVRCVKD